MAELMSTGHFGTMEKDVDEDEHSIEMQLPYLAKVFEGFVRPIHRLSSVLLRACSNASSIGMT
jgi:predicted class III extradiol MEMO1 family dioxygenase